MSANQNLDRYVRFSLPLIGEEEIEEVVDTLRSGWITSGPKTKQFESAFAEYVQAPAALAMNSCTAALHTALVVAGIGPGDQVITSDVTFAATVNVIEHVGAEPVLVDIRPDTMNLDARKIAERITDRTKAIIPVHFAGHPVDLDEVREIAEQRGLLVLEDAAHALPASVNGQMIGSGHNPVAFSFYATKNLTCAEGGMLTGDPEFLERARVIALHGLSREAWGRYEKGGAWKYDVAVPGFKYNMTDIQAAIGIWQLRKLSAFQNRRLEIVHAYQRAFEDLDVLELPTANDGIGHAWHLFILRLNLDTLTIDRDEFIEQLHERGIGTSVHFIPIHLHSFYRTKYGYGPNDFPESMRQFQRCLSLPLNPSLSDDNVAHVIEATREVSQRYRRQSSTWRARRAA